VAGDGGDSSDDLKDTSHERRECMPCRGTGQVISNLGGSASHVSCPWCGGGGVRVPGIDAQAHWIAERGEGSAREQDEDAAATPPPEQ
jgi:DnaJ-class molecular chaperone